MMHFLFCFSSGCIYLQRCLHKIMKVVFLMSILHDDSSLFKYCTHYNVFCVSTNLTVVITQMYGLVI